MTIDGDQADTKKLTIEDEWAESRANWCRLSEVIFLITGLLLSVILALSLFFELDEFRDAMAGPEFERGSLTWWAANLGTWAIPIYVILSAIRDLWIYRTVHTFVERLGLFFATLIWTSPVLYAFRVADEYRAILSGVVIMVLFFLVRILLSRSSSSVFGAHPN